MKKLFKKPRFRRGETLVEILVAVLVVSLAAALFAGLYSAAANINVTARKQDKNFYDAVSNLEQIYDSEEEPTSQGTLKYTPAGENATQGGGEQEVEVDVVTQDGMSVYKDGK